MAAAVIEFIPSFPTPPTYCTRIDASSPSHVVPNASARLILTRFALSSLTPPPVPPHVQKERYYSDVNDYSECKVKKKCIVGEGVSNIGNADVDTQCSSCSGKTYSDANDYGACAAMTECGAGFGASVAGTATSDTQCQACVAAADDTDRIGSYSTSSGYEPCVAHSTCPLGSGCAGPATIQAKKLVGYWEQKNGGMWGNDWNWDFCGQNANCVGNTCSNEVKCKEAAYNTQTNAYCDAPRGNGQMKLAYVADNVEDPTNAFGKALLSPPQLHVDVRPPNGVEYFWLAVFECCPANGCSTAPLSVVPPLDIFGNCFPLTLGTATTDTTCHVCPDGSYSAASSPGIDGVTHNVRVCLPHSTCAKGKGIKSAGTTTTDTVCQDCNAAGTTPKTFSDTDDKSACVAHTSCGPGSGVSVLGGAAVDTACVPCNNVGAATASTFSDVNSPTEACKSWQTCDGRHGAVVAGTSATDIKCELCVGHTDHSDLVPRFPTSLTAKSCTDCYNNGNCPQRTAGEQEWTQTAKVWKDAECSNIGNVQPGSLVDCQAGCLAQATCTAFNFKEVGGGQCSLRDCSAGTIPTWDFTNYVGYHVKDWVRKDTGPCKWPSFSSSNDFGKCVDKTGCGPGQYVPKVSWANGALRVDNTCEPCPTATYQDAAFPHYEYSNSFAVQPGSACKPQVTCGLGESAAGTATTSSKATCTACSAGTFSDKVSIDNSCDACTASCPHGNAVGACTASVDLTCTACPSETYDARPLSGLNAGTTAACVACAAACNPTTQTETATCTPTSNRVCENKGACAGGTWSSSGFAPCAPWKTCPACEGKTVEGTSSTDRTCAACPSLQFSVADDGQQCAVHAQCAVGMGVITPCNGPDFVGKVLQRAPELPGCSSAVWSGGKLEADGSIFGAAKPWCTNTNQGTDPWYKLCCAWDETATDGRNCVATGDACRDTVCESCPVGFYSPTLSYDACIPWTKAPPGYGINSPSHNGTASTDTTVTACSAGEFSDETSYAACQPRTSCPAGRGQVAVSIPLKDKDTVCEDCVAPRFSAAADLTACDTMTTCPAGEGARTPAAWSLAPAKTNCQSHCDSAFSINCADVTVAANATHPLVENWRIQKELKKIGDTCAGMVHAREPPTGYASVRNAGGSLPNVWQCFRSNSFSCTFSETVGNRQMLCPCVAASSTTSDSNLICEACESGYYSAANDYLPCIAHDPCGVGEGLSVAGDRNRNTACTTCVAGTTFSDSTGFDTCVPVGKCAVGMGLKVAATASTDTECEVCPAGTFSDASDLASCTPHSACDVGQGVVAGGAGTDRADTICVSCTAGSTFSSTSSTTETCQSVSGCPKGQGPDVAAADKIRDTKCDACATGTFSDVTDLTTCKVRREEEGGGRTSCLLCRGCAVT